VDSQKVRRGPVAKQWVTKSDILSYKYCPYSFWLTDSGIVNLDELLATYYAVVDVACIRAGIKFEERILDDIPPLLKGRSAEDVGAQYLFGVPTYRNAERMLAGRAVSR